MAGDPKQKARADLCKAKAQFERADAQREKASAARCESIKGREWRA